MTQFDEPELVGYVPTEGMPHRRRIRSVMRVVVLVGIVCLILPGVLIAWGSAQRAAQFTCASLVRSAAASGATAVARFEAFGPAGPQWYCYAVGFGGREQLLSGLGMLPGPHSASTV